jgi:pantoate--beta-alanine ligase
MGNLHAGHLSLVELARRHADRVVVSIFVNPLQFSAGEDFERYPRTIAEDSAQLQAAGVDLLFVPELVEVYPADPATLSFVEVPGLSDDLCGRFRPGHFRGVTTVVCKLLNLVQPDCAAFGEKDYQQLTIIRRMVNDLNMPVTIVAGATRRDRSGLALSSRNSYLTVAERQRAALLYRSLAAAAGAIDGGERAFSQVEQDVTEKLTQAGFRVDYISIRCSSDLATPKSGDRRLIILGAVRLGHTRLIDNHRIDLP